MPYLWVYPIDSLRLQQLKKTQDDSFFTCTFYSGFKDEIGTHFEDVECSEPIISIPMPSILNKQDAYTRRVYVSAT